jgi:hypothetical protein
MKKRMSTVYAASLALAAFVLALSLASCGGGGGGDDDDPPPGGASHTYEEVLPTMGALTAAMTAAGASEDSSSSAYYTLDATSYVMHFNGFTNDGITVNGSLTQTVATGDTNGTITFSGSNVSSLVYHDANFTTHPATGTCTFTLTDGGVWVYDWATESYIET